MCVKKKTFLMHYEWPFRLTVVRKSRLNFGASHGRCEKTGSDGRSLRRMRVCCNLWRVWRNPLDRLFRKLPTLFFFPWKKHMNFPLRLLLWCTPKIFPTQAYIFNSSEDCRLCRNSLAVHLLKIAGCLLSWWTWWNIANKRTCAFCCAGFLLWRRHCVARGFIADTFRLFFLLFFFSRALGCECRC